MGTTTFLPGNKKGNTAMSNAAVIEEVQSVSAIRSFIVENFLLGKDYGFGDDESLLDTGIMDSTGIMHIVAHLEETYAIAIDDEELTADNLDSVRKIAAFVLRKRATLHAA
jgi:acyl carrier protein